MKAEFAYEIAEEDIKIFSKLDSLEKLLWLESLFELIVVTDTKNLAKIRDFFRKDE